MIYSKIPNVTDVATKNNFVKNKETKLYVDYYVENEDDANELYKEMLVVCREHYGNILNKLSHTRFYRLGTKHF